MGQHVLTMKDLHLIDSYSRTVAHVAETVGPATAKIEVQTGSAEQKRRSGREGSGSGFVFAPDGLILTNSHVVHGARHIDVLLPGLEPQRARLVGEDPHTDLAVISISGHELPYVELGESKKLRVGQI